MAIAITCNCDYYSIDEIIIIIVNSVEILNVTPEVSSLKQQNIHICIDYLNYYRVPFLSQEYILSVTIDFYCKLFSLQKNNLKIS